MSPFLSSDPGLRELEQPTAAAGRLEAVVEKERDGGRICGGEARIGVGWLEGVVCDSGARGYSQPTGARDHVTRTPGRGRPPPLGAAARRRRFGSWGWWCGWARREGGEGGGGGRAGVCGAVRVRVCGWAAPGRVGSRGGGEAGSGKGGHAEIGRAHV